MEHKGAGGAAAETSRRQVRAGWRGAAAIGAVGLLFFRVAVVAFCKAAVRTLPGAVGGIRRAVLRG